MRSVAGPSVRQRGHLLFSSAAALLLAGAVEARQGERFSLPGTDAAIYNLVGQVNVTAAIGPDVTVQVVPGGRDAERLRVETGPIEGRATLRVLYPRGDVVYPTLGPDRGATLRVRDNGTFGGGILNSRQVRVRGSGGGIEAYADLNIAVPIGGSLSLHHGVGEVLVSNIDGALRVTTVAGSVRCENSRGELDVSTGAGELVFLRIDGGTLLARTGSGRISLSGIEATEATLRTDSGNIRILGLDASTLDLETGSGAVYGLDLSAGSIVVRTGSGRIGLSRVSAFELRAETGSGSVRLALETGIGSARIGTGSGSVTLSVPPNLGAELEINSGTGGVSVGLPATNVTSQGNSFRGRLGNGQGAVRIQTDSGQVLVQSR